MNTMKKLSEAIRLWPHPDEAPEVPPESVLRSFLADPGSVDADLAEQIRSSPNCARILESLRRQPEPAFRSEHTVFFDQLRRITSGAGTKRSETNAIAPCEAPRRKGKRFGTVWTTRGAVELWTGERMARRFTYRPLTVVIVQEASEMPWDDTLYRAIPLTPALVWPDDWLASDELRLSLPGVDRFAAHLWLEYPVSGCQLDRCLGQLPTCECDNLKVGLAALGEGLPLTPDEGGGGLLDPERDTEILLERERLHACAAWLAATADARREWWETLNESPVEWFGSRIDFAMMERPVRMVREALPMAAADGLPPIPVFLKNSQPEKGMLQSVGMAKELNRAPFQMGPPEAKSPIQSRFAIRLDTDLDALLRPLPGDTVRLIGRTPNGTVQTLAVGEILPLSSMCHEVVARVTGSRKELEALSLDAEEHALIVMKKNSP